MTSNKVVTGAKVITRNRDVDFVSVAPFEVNDEKLWVVKMLWMPLHGIFHVKSSKISHCNNTLCNTAASIIGQKKTEVLIFLDEMQCCIDKFNEGWTYFVTFLDAARYFTCRLWSIMQLSTRSTILSWNSSSWMVCSRWLTCVSLSWSWWMSCVVGHRVAEREISWAVDWPKAGDQGQWKGANTEDNRLVVMWAYGGTGLGWTDLD